MLKHNDMMSVNITDEELKYCLENPAPECTRAQTGQLQALGDLAICKALSIPFKEFKLQEEAASEMGASYVCEIRNGLIAGVSPTVSTIRVDDVLSQRVVVPVNRLYKNPRLNKHFTVGVFLNCLRNSEQQIIRITRAVVAGWIRSDQLKRWVKKGGHSPFTTRHTALATAPCAVLHPMRKLTSTLKWEQFCV